MIKQCKGSMKKFHIYIEILLKICQNNTVHSHQRIVDKYFTGVLGQYYNVINNQYAGGIDYESDRYTGPQDATCDFQ